MFRPRSLHAFTLVELLCVLVVICILAALLFPVIMRVRESARCAQCLSNLRQMGVSAGTYSAEHQNSLPRSYYTAQSGVGSDQWFVALSRYMGVDPLQSNTAKLSPVFACASNSEVQDIKNSVSPAWNKPTATYHDQTWPYVGDYGYNNRIAPTATTKASALINPAITPLVVEIWWQNNFGSESFDPITTDPKDGVVVSNRHNGNTNSLWADGHVTSMKREALQKYVRTLGGARPTESSANANALCLGIW